MADWRPIHEVLALLRPKHPNLSISKIRWLEYEGKVRTIRGVDGRLQYDPQEVSVAMPTWDW